MADLRDLRNRIRVRAYFAVSDASPRLQSVLRSNSPRKTGELINKTTVVPRGLEATARAAVNYASYQREGTRPHKIPRVKRTRGQKMLSFYWPVTGRQMFLPQVNHPGTKANSWWDDAIRKWPDFLRDSLRRAP